MPAAVDPAFGIALPSTLQKKNETNAERASRLRATDIRRRNESFT